MSNQARLHVLGAFLLGIVLTVAWEKSKSKKDPESHRHDRQLDETARCLPNLDSIVSPNDLERTISSSVDRFDGSAGSIQEGIEGCIGQTPLIKIKSLSDATQCEILAKAEFLNGAGNSPKDRVALSIIEMAEEKAQQSC